MLIVGGHVVVYRKLGQHARAPSMLHIVLQAVGPMLCADLTSGPLTGCDVDASTGKKTEDDAKGDMGFVG